MMEKMKLSCEIRRQVTAPLLATLRHLGTLVLSRYDEKNSKWLAAEPFSEIEAYKELVSAIEKNHKPDTIFDKISQIQQELRLSGEHACADPSCLAVKHLLLAASSYVVMFYYLTHDPELKTRREQFDRFAVRMYTNLVEARQFADSTDSK